MTEWFIISTGACLAGFLLDFLFGDPVWLYHPIRIIGKGIALTERLLRRLFGQKKDGGSNNAGAAAGRQIFGGGVLWAVIAVLTFLIPLGLLVLVYRIHPAAGGLLETFWCFQILAARSLCRESGKVYDRLRENDLAGARKAVSMIVGRDTENLTVEGVTKAAVETVAENTSDGVTAPLIFLLIGGAPLGFLYKAVNTMDSMLGYKNEKYLYFGRIPAKMDDVFNYIPSRITALLMIAAARLWGMDSGNAWRIWRRDSRKHASPNSAQTEAACAGALRVRLAGDAFYFGRLYKKDYIGDDIRPVEPEDIRRAGRLMYGASALMLTAGILIKCTLILILCA